MSRSTSQAECLADVLYFLVISLLFSLFKGKIIWLFVGTANLTAGNRTCCAVSRA